MHRQEKDALLFTTHCEGKQARSVLVDTPRESLAAVQADHELDGDDPTTARRKAFEFFEVEARRVARDWAAAGCLDHRDDDLPLSVPVDLDLPASGRQLRGSALPGAGCGDSCCATTRRT